MEEKLIRISKTTKKVLESVNSKWPINTLEVANLLGDRGNVKTLSSKYLYHFKKLHQANLIEMKKVGNTYIAWPKNLEKMRNVEKKRKLMVVYNV